MSSSLSHTFSPSRPFNDGSTRYPLPSQPIIDYMRFETEQIRKLNEKKNRLTVSYPNAVHGKNPTA
jgi:hypothetical protein